MSWPNITYSFLDAGIGLVDIWLVSKLSADAVSGVGLSRQVFFLIIIVSVAFTAGAAPIIGQSFGSKNYKRVQSVAQQTLMAMTLIGIILGFVYYITAESAMNLLGAEPQTLTEGVRYTAALAPGVVFLFINYTMVSLFRGIGYVRLPLLVSIFMHVINIITSYVFIFGIDGHVQPMGVAGAAYGTIMSRLTGAVVFLILWRYVMLKLGAGKMAAWKFEKETVKDILTIGVPVGFMNLTRTGAHIIFFKILAASGTVALAAGFISYQIRTLIVMPSLAIQFAVITLVSHSLGRGEFKRAKSISLHTLFYGLFFTGVVSLLFCVFAEPIIRLHSESDPAILPIGIMMLRICLIGQLFATGCIILCGALYGGGDTKLPFAFTVVSEWLLMLPLAYIIVNFTDLDVAWIYLAFAVSSFAFLSFTIVRFRQGKWLKQF